MVKTRLAPSPTGEDLHIGNLQTALFNFAFAKKNKGKFIVRIEDTDRSRYVENAEKQILKSLEDYGLKWDESPYRQSERLEIYKKHAEKLIEKKAAYYCFCSSERLEELRKSQQAEKKISRYDKHCLNTISLEEAQKKISDGEKYVVRLNVKPGQEITFNDMIRGEIKFNSNDIDDQVLLKSDGFPTYHLGVVVDDHLMEITHVIRGEDWISSTPKHVMLYDAFGWDRPVFAHQSLLRNTDKSKLSKRKNPVWAHWYLDQGFLPEAVLNYLALLGWSHPEEKEKFDLAEFIRVFDPKDLQVVGPVFDVVKLEWLNGMYIRAIADGELRIKIQEFIGNKYSSSIVEKTVPLIKERIKKLSDYLPIVEFFFQKPESYEIELSDKKYLIKKIYDELLKIDNWKADIIGQELTDLAAREGIKNSEFFMTLRVAISGKKITPPLNESIEILGREETLSRLEKLC